MSYRNHNHNNNYRNNNNNNNNNNRRRYSGSRNRRSHSILPPVAVLERYGEDGKNRLITMAEEEQIHRHDWEAAYLRAYTRSHRFGQFFGFIVSLALIYTVFSLSQAGDPETAIALALGGFFALGMCALVGIKTRRISRRPRRPQSQRPQFNQESYDAKADLDVEEEFEEEEERVKA